jgi:hypothetical protein
VVAVLIQQHLNLFGEPRMTVVKPFRPKKPHSYRKIFICNLNIDVKMFSLYTSLLSPDIFMRIMAPSLESFILPVAFAEFRTQEDLGTFLPDSEVAPLPFPGSEAEFDKSKIYILPLYVIEFRCASFVDLHGSVIFGRLILERENRSLGSMQGL